MTDHPQQPEPFIVVRGEAPADHALGGAVVAIGNFDGVHRGYCAVIAAALACAKALSRPAAALTFEPHPRRSFPPEVPLFLFTHELAKPRLLAGHPLAQAYAIDLDEA